MQQHPDARLLRLGVGDVTLPLCDAVIRALHKAVDDQANKATFHGYMPECGAEFLKEAICGHYARRGVTLDTEEFFISCGAGDDLGNTLIFLPWIIPRWSSSQPTRLMSIPISLPAIRLIHLPADSSCGFAPLPDDSLPADIIYICSPNNPPARSSPARSSRPGWTTPMPAVR